MQVRRCGRFLPKLEPRRLSQGTGPSCPSTQGLARSQAGRGRESSAEDSATEISMDDNGQSTGKGWQEDFVESQRILSSLRFNSAEVGQQSLFRGSSKRQFVLRFRLKITDVMPLMQLT